VAKSGARGRATDSFDVYRVLEFSRNYAERGALSTFPSSVSTHPRQLRPDNIGGNGGCTPPYAPLWIAEMVRRREDMNAPARGSRSRTAPV
jgi:hypothetical protein